MGHPMSACREVFDTAVGDPCNQGSYTATDLTGYTADLTSAAYWLPYASSELYRVSSHSADVGTCYMGRMGEFLKGLSEASPPTGAAMCCRGCCCMPAAHGSAGPRAPATAGPSAWLRTRRAVPLQARRAAGQQSWPGLPAAQLGCPNHAPTGHPPSSGSPAIPNIITSHPHLHKPLYPRWYS